MRLDMMDGWIKLSEWFRNLSDIKIFVKNRHVASNNLYHFMYLLLFIIWGDMSIFFYYWNWIFPVGPGYSCAQEGVICGGGSTCNNGVCECDSGSSAIQGQCVNSYSPNLAPIRIIILNIFSIRFFCFIFKQRISFLVWLILEIIVKFSSKPSFLNWLFFLYLSTNLLDCLC